MRSPYRSIAALLTVFSLLVVLVTVQAAPLLGTVATVNTSSIANLPDDNQYLAIMVSNFIGTGYDGGLLDHGNAMEGILLVNTLHTVATPWIVSSNGGAGIAVTGASAESNDIRPNYDGFNGGLAIDLGNDGFTPNLPGGGGSGPNGWLNYPQVTYINGSTLSGSACPNCTILFYKSIAYPTYAGGAASLYFPYFHTSSDAAGAWSYTLPAGLTPQTVTLQACQAADCIASPDANTSELSPVVTHFIYLPNVRR